MLDLSDDIKKQLDNHRTKIFTTLERIFDSTVGRSFLKVEPDADHGLKGSTTKQEFLKGFTKLVTDVAQGRQSSRTLNTNEDIRRSEEHTSELQSLMRISYAVFCLKKKKNINNKQN